MNFLFIHCFKRRQLYLSERNLQGWIRITSAASYFSSRRILIVQRPQLEAFCARCLIKSKNDCFINHRAKRLSAF